MPVLCVIPARIGSTRLPEKPLRLLRGTPLIVHVVNRVLELDPGAELVVASDDPRVCDAVAPLGVTAILTGSRHGSGTERVAEVADLPRFAGFDAFLNVQGDEPFLSGEAVAGAVARVEGGDQVGTAAAPLSPAHAADPNRVKVIVGPGGRALGFSRRLTGSMTQEGHRCYQHLGVYAYTRAALAAWVRATPVPAERVERLEQLRPLALGMSIGVAVIDEPAPLSIDTEEDLALAEHHLGVSSRR